MMTNEERNTALYKKLFAEQEVFRDWLKSQSPEEILRIHDPGGHSAVAGIPRPVRCPD